MGFILTPENRAKWSAWPDDRFPDVMGVWREGAVTVLGELPKAGNGLNVLCCGCWDVRWVSGADICRRWPDWLLRAGDDWARALRCPCGAKRFRFMALADPAAAGFGTPDQSPSMAFARRLAAWLPAEGPSVHELAAHLAAMPTSAEIDAAGL